jgi:murein DD-endopeptidase MepM/ murein hydrolase activator NlpD
MESEKKLEVLIDNLVIKEEKARRAATHNRRNNNREPEPENEPSLGPAHGPHSLSWPSAGHRIVQGFGEHRNAELNTVTMNLGIDIAAAQGSAVNAAAEGEVDIVSSLPSYGTIVVLRHAGGLHTVYADLAGASIRKGAHVRSGQQIGTSGTNEENGAVLHFEVWKGKSKQNPLGWLR